MTAWTALLVALIAIFALDAVLARVADRWFGPPARPAGAETAPLAPASAEDMGVGFVGAEFDEEWKWPR